MKLIFEGTTDEFTEAFAVLKCFATVENIVDDEPLDVFPSTNDEFSRDLIHFFTAISRGSVHIESCQTHSTEIILRVFNAHRFWSFKINSRTFDNESPAEVAKRCIEEGHKSES